MLQYILYGFLSYILFVIYRYYEHKKYMSECLKCFNGPKPKFLIGNASDFAKNPVDNFQRLQELQNKYGPITKLFLGPSRIYLLTSEPDLVEILLASPTLLKKSSDYEIMRPWLFNGILISNGKYWQKRRKIITPTFHFKILEDFLPVFNTGSDVLIENLQSKVGKDINIFPYIAAFTLDSICETAMGTSVNAQNSPNNKYVNAIRTICNLYIKRKFSPWKKNNFLFQFSSDYKTQSAALDIIHGFTKSVIEKRRNDLLNQTEHKEVLDDTGVKRKTAFLDLLLKSTIDGEGLSDMDILEEVETFMFAGQDTTSTAISFALYVLAHHPKVQDKIIVELRDMFADGMNREFSMQDFNNMKYLELVIKETMRLYPPIPYFSRELEQDLEYKGVTIPKGVTITVHAFHMHRRPELFKNPEEFNPERFLFDNSEKRNHFAYIPFSAGARNCIGQKYAMLELKTTLSKILWNFKILPADPKYNIILSGEVVLTTANGVTVRLEKREI